MSLMARLKGSFTTLLGHKLDERHKRMIVLASLFAKMHGDKTRIDIGIAEKLNEVLRLSNKDAALMFPIQLHRVIWKDGVTTVEMQSCDLTSSGVQCTAKSVSDKIPAWLQYGSLDGMRKDIEKLLQCKADFAI